MFNPVITRCKTAGVFELVGAPIKNPYFNALAVSGYCALPMFHAGSVVTTASHLGQPTCTLDGHTVPAEVISHLSSSMAPVYPNEYRWHHIAFKAGLDPKDSYMLTSIIDRLLERKAITGQQVVDALVWVEEQIMGDIEF